MRSFVEHFKQVCIRRKQVPISRAAIALYYTLLEYDNELGWMDNFTCANKALEAQADLSKDSLHRARQELTQKGYIHYRKGTTRQAGSYTIVDFATNSTTNRATNSTTNSTTNRATNNRPIAGTLTRPDKDQDQSITPISPQGEAAAPQEKKRKRFVPPTVEEVAAYCCERSNGIDPSRFVDYYQSKGWVVGKSPMKDWRAAVRQWEQRRKEDAGGAKKPDIGSPEYYKQSS